MSARARGRREICEQDFELNIASIIDCFTVIITYLLISASFISIGVFDVGGTVLSENAGDPPRISLAIRLMGQNRFALELTGKAAPDGKQVVDVPAASGGWNYAALAEDLRGMTGKWPELTSASIAAVDGIEYKDLVKTIETVRGVIPSVAIGDQVVDTPSQ